MSNGLHSPQVTSLICDMHDKAIILTVLIFVISSL